MSGDEPTEAARVHDEGYVPTGVDGLVGYVDSLDEPVVSLQWVDDGRRRTTLAVGVTPVPAGVPATDTPAVDVRSVAVGSTVARPVPVSAVESVRPVADAQTATAALPTDSRSRVATLRGLAEHAPELVHVAVVLPMLDHDSPVVVEALSCLTDVAHERADDCVAAVPLVLSLLSGPDEGESGGENEVRVGALSFLAALAAARPADVVPHLDRVCDWLASSETAAVAAAVRCVSSVAGAEPTAVVDHGDELTALLGADDGEIRMHAAYALGRVAVVSPETVRPHVARLAVVVGDRSARTPTRLNAACAVGRVAGEWPDAVVDHLETFVETLAAADARLRANAAGVVGDVAVSHPVDVRHHLEPLVARLDDEDGTVRVNASTAVARVAREFPDAAVDHVGRLVGALDDEESVVRENACWTLGSLQGRARTARAALEGVHADDGDEQVRDRARWALDELPVDADGTGVGD